MLNYDTQEYDSLAFDPEDEEGFIPSCPWMSVVKKEIASSTVYPQPIISRGIDYEIDSSDFTYYNQEPVQIGDDFSKRCEFKYIPNKLFNMQIVYDNNQ